MAKRFSLKIWITWIFACFILVPFISSTYDSGDSILHYLFARYAPSHPNLFFDHWGKPVFTVLSSPFAQFGFKGIVWFNIICIATTALLTYKIAESISLPLPKWIFLLLIFAPKFFLSQFSGLTEPLFSLVLMTGLYYWFNERKNLGLIILSFLPFVRSEGLVILTILSIWLTTSRAYNKLPFLATGTLFWMLAGGFHHQDLLWVFNKIPYAGDVERYGHGDWFHYFIQFPYVSGWPFFVLLIAAVFILIGNIVLKNPYAYILKRQKELLLWIIFLAYVGAHAIFWKFGIFKSFGLNRVLIPILPVAALLSLEVFKHIQKSKIALITTFIVIILFPFSGNKAGFDFKKDFSLSPEQKTINIAGEWYRNSTFKNRYVFYGNPYFSIALQVDHFNPQRCAAIRNVTAYEPNKGDLVFWDPFFAPVEMNVPIDILQEKKKYKLLKKWPIGNPANNGSDFIAVFEKR